jgi:hypothetical protein
LEEEEVQEEDDTKDDWERGAERVGEGAGAEPGAASSVIHAGRVRPRPLPARMGACEDESKGLLLLRLVDAICR